MQTRTSPISKLRTLIACALLAVALTALAPTPASAARCPGAYENPNSASTATVRSATLCLVNAERRQRGMRNLRHNGRLAEAATRHASDMVRRDYFSHDSPGGTDMVDRILRTDYIRASTSSWTVAENIAWGSDSRATPVAIVRMWMHSPGHRANILNRRFEEIGVGIVRGAPRRGVSNAATYVNNFGARG